MKKIIKFSAWGAGILIVLIVIAIAAFALLFDPNALRDDITRVVEQKTGRQLNIEGDLSLTYFPWIGFAAGRTTLSNPAGFSSPEMLRFETASASVKLLPLFSKRIEISQVTLDGMNLQLEVKKDGTSNWSDLEALQTKDPAATDTDASGFASDGIGGIRLTNTLIKYVDAQAGDQYEISNLDLETGPLAPGKTFKLEASGELASASHEVNGPAQIKGEVQIDDSGELRMTDPKIQWLVRGAGVPGDELELKIEAPTLELTATKVNFTSPVVDLAGTGSGDPWKTLQAHITGESLSLVDFDRFDVPALELSAGVTAPELPNERVDITMTGERMQGSIDHQSAAIDVVRLQWLDLSVFSKKAKASSFIDDLVLEAPIEVAEFSPLKLLAKMGYDEIVTADPKALSSSSLSGNARYGPDWMGIQNLDGKVDQTAVSGSVKIMASGQTRFNVTADEVNLDRYRAPSEEPTTAGEAVTIDDIEIPAEELRLLALDGTLAIGKMQLVGLHSTDVNFAIRAAGGDIRIKPASAKLYGGTYQGDIRLDATGALPVLSLNEQLDSVQFGPFSADLLDSKRLSGALSGRITVSGTGHTANAITASTNGDAVFKFVDGAYEGANLPYQMRRARALIKGQPAPPQPTENRTPFGDLSGTAKIVDGVMTSDDINMVMPFMKVSGGGSLVLLSQEMNFNMVANVYDRPELDAGDNELVGFPVPIKMTGTLAAPDVGVNMGGLLAALAKRKLLGKLGLGDKPPADPDAAANPDETAVEEEKDVKEELEDKLKDKLKDLFGGG